MLCGQQTPKQLSLAADTAAPAAGVTVVAASAALCADGCVLCTDTGPAI